MCCVVVCVMVEPRGWCGLAGGSVKFWGGVYLCEVCRHFGECFPGDCNPGAYRWVAQHTFEAIRRSYRPPLAFLRVLELGGIG